jgi:5-formyltetrahydrofolate cyclo-ligase
MDPVVVSWRKQQRAALIAARAAVPLAERHAVAGSIAERLNDLLVLCSVTTLGLYWPIKNEVNLLQWARALALSKGVTLCLPVVVTPKAPLEYWRWVPGEAMRPGVWNIPAPAQRDVVVPDLVLAPLVGFDGRNYRLGYGGGYFDRTLASLKPRPVAVGVGYEFGMLETIYPQPHDVPMHTILTEHRATTLSVRRDHAV